MPEKTSVIKIKRRDTNILKKLSNELSNLAYLIFLTLSDYKYIKKTIRENTVGERREICKHKDIDAKRFLSIRLYPKLLFLL